MTTGSGEAQELGKRNLGSHAFETQMPPKIASLIEADDLVTNTHAGVIRNLSELLEQDPNVGLAYLCHEDVLQVHKLYGEGSHFCGYRNMQMLLSALDSTRSSRTNALTSVWTIPRLQRAIEHAWDQDINAHGRIQTGGILNTRKHVGTSEAEALLLSLEVPCIGTAYSGKDAWRELLEYCEQYYAAGVDSTNRTEGVQRTSLPPIFLQRPGHSITVVGIERSKSGRWRILTFDPAWKPPAMMMGKLESKILPRWRRRYLLGNYRKGHRYLQRYHAFETLVVDSHHSTQESTGDLKVHHIRHTTAAGV